MTTCEMTHLGECPGSPSGPCPSRAGVGGSAPASVQCARSDRLEHEYHVGHCPAGCTIVWHLDTEDPFRTPPTDQHALIADAAADGLRFDGTEVMQ